MLLRVVVVSVFLITSVCSSSLLPYVKPCPRSLPNINECFFQTAKDTLPHFAKGDEKHRVQPIEPFKIDRFEVVQSGGSSDIKFIFTNIVANGFKNLNLTAAGIDLQKRRAFFRMVTPEINSTADYTVDGRLLLLPVVGKGVFTVNAHNIHFNLTIDYDLQKKQFNKSPEKQHFILRKMITNFYIEDATMMISGLFNGNKQLGDTFNEFMNKNYKAILEDLKPAISYGLHEMIRVAYSQVEEFVPYDDLFPE